MCEERLLWWSTLKVGRKAADDTRQQFQLADFATCVEGPGITSVPDIRSLDTADSASAVPTSILQMSSSRLATQVFSSSLRCRAGNFQGTAGSLTWAFARGFQQSAVSRKTVQKLQQKPPANDDETLKAMDTLQALAHKTNMDVWSQPIETLGK